MRAAWIRLVSKLALFVFILFFGDVLLVSAETTFLANFNNSDGLSGNAQFSPDFQIGNTFTVSTRSTAAGETVDLPSGSAPNLSLVKRVFTGASSLDIHGGRDGLFYTNLASGSVSRREGTAEGFFLTPYSLFGNTEPRTFLSGWVSFTNGSRWYYQISAAGNRLTANFGDNSSNPAGAVSIQSLPFSPEEWKSDQWHHVAVTWNAAAGAFQLFADGRLVGRATGSLPVTSAIESAGGNRVYVGMGSAGTGALNSGQGSNLEGWVDSVRFDNTVLYDGSSFAVGDRVFTPPTAESWRSLRVFNSSQTSWQSSNAGAPTLKTFDHRTRGFEFTCDLQTVIDRCSWEAATSLNLLGPVSSSAWLYVTNASEISDFSLSFRSGNGWYSWSAPVYDGWNDLAINLEEMKSEGVTDGLTGIDRVRVTLLKRPGGNGEVKLAVYDVETSSQRMDERPFELPEYDLSLPARLDRREPNGNLFLENRAIWDEAPHYLGQGADFLLNRIGSAGFNIYLPTVWHGRGAIYRSETARLDPIYASIFQGSSDPLADLILKAHQRGMEVHGWFTVALREDSTLYPEFAEIGTPNGAFDLQNPAFRDFIVNEIIGFVRKYNVDGIFLDYIRTFDISFSSTASNLYFQRYGRNIDELRLNPMPPDVEARMVEWQRDAVADIVRRIRQGVNEIKPGLTISAYGRAEPKPKLNFEGRNLWYWVENDWVDVVYDGDYSGAPDGVRLAASRQSSLYPERFTRMLGNYESRFGTVFNRDPHLLLKQIDYFLRKFPERGTGLYLYSMLSDEQIASLRAGPFRQDALPFFNIKDDFEPKTAGGNLNTDLRWTGHNAPPSYVPNAYIANNIAARGSSRSVVFKDTPGGNQVYWLNLVSSKAAATIEFDVYLDDRNPRGGANFEIRPSTGTGGTRELSLYLAQQSPTSWMLSIWKRDGIVAYARNIPLKTWHRIKFRNDILNHTFTVALDGNILAADVAYGSGINTLSQIDTIQWRNISSDEDVYIDNIVIREP